jgi:hypothetical protein
MILGVRINKSNEELHLLGCEAIGAHLQHRGMFSLDLQQAEASAGPCNITSQNTVLFTVTAVVRSSEPT